MRTARPFALVTCLFVAACGDVDPVEGYVPPGGPGQSGDPSNPANRQALGLVNPSFEEGKPPVWEASKTDDIPGWTRILEGKDSTVIREKSDPNSGDHSLKVWGPEAGVYQHQPTEPGQSWAASCSLYMRLDDPLKPNLEAVVELSFVDQGGATIPGSVSVSPEPVKPPPASQPGNWFVHHVVGVAPPGAYSARISLLLQGSSTGTGPGGSVRFDDASLAPQ